MRTFVNAVVTRRRLLFVLTLGIASLISIPLKSADGPSVDVCFNPNGGCDKKVFAVIDHYMTLQPRTIIRFNAYFLTSYEFASRFEQMANLGFDVRGLVDHECSEGRFASACKDTDMPNVKTKRVFVRHGIDHDKYIILGDSTVITGSANLTIQAYKYNYENVLVITDPTVVKKYVDDFESIYQVTQ